MKRSRGSSDSLAAFLPICHSATDKQINPTTATTGFLYGGAGDYSPMFEEEDIDIGDGNASSMKKRRLSVEQVKALEKNFEIDNKLEPERKVKLAQELGLQPRQVAIWFQNRRARWKTKQLERDFGVLKSNYDALKRSRDSLQHDNDSLLKEIKELRAKLNMDESVTTEENGGLNTVEAVALTNSDVIGNEILELSHPHHHQPPPPPIIPAEAPTELNFDIFNIFPRAESFGENSTDSSDSSAVLNEEYSPTAVEAVAAAATAVEMSCFGQFVKMEEHGDLFSGEEACKLFADNEQFYCSGQWTA